MSSVGINAKTEKKINLVLSRAQALGYEEEIHVKALEKLIIECWGHDRRTIKRAIELMVMYDRLRHKTRSVYMIVGPEGPTLDRFDVPKIKVEKSK